MPVKLERLERLATLTPRRHDGRALHVPERGSHRDRVAAHFLVRHPMNERSARDAGSGRHQT